jgi:ubiquinone/menaquinone biosynthesis C-methylase UbiE
MAVSPSQLRVDRRPPPAPSAQVRLLQQEFSRAKEYAAEYQGNTPIAHFFNTRLQRVAELLADFTRGRVLDVGCGPALVGDLFRGRPILYHGLDVSEDMVREGAGRFADDPRFRFSVARIEELPFPDDSFDVLLCLGALEYVPEAEAAIQEMARVVRRNGVVIITMLNCFSPYRLWSRYGYERLRHAAVKLRSAARRTNGDADGRERVRPISREYGQATLRRLVGAGGLQIEDVLYYDFNVFLEPLDMLFPSASVQVSRRLEFLCRSAAKDLGTGFIIKARRC